MKIIHYTENPREEDLIAIKELFQEYAQSLKIDLEFQNFKEELDKLPGIYSPPLGLLILAKADGRPAGSIALRPIDGEYCEMKRLYVRKEFRGLGLGLNLIEKLIDHAKKVGYKYMRLDTLPSMKKAITLYKGLGFYEIDPYIYNPIKGTHFMELKL